MSRPGTRLAHYYAKIDQTRSRRSRSEHYDQIAVEASAKWREIADTLGDEALDRTIQQLGRVISHRARLVDKLNLYKTLIADGIGKDDGGLSDHQAIVILAGWATERQALNGEEEE